jgi:hypothetical protein
MAEVQEDKSAPPKSFMSKVVNFIYEQMFAVPPSSREHLDMLRNFQIAWVPFLCKFTLYTLVIPLILSYAVLFVPLRSPLEPGNAHENGNWPYVFYVIIFCWPAGFLPQTLSSVYLMKRDVLWNAYTWKGFAFFVIVGGAVIFVGNMLVYPFPYTGLTLSVPIWFMLNVVTQKSKFYLPPEFQLKEELKRKTTICFLFGFFFAGSYYSFVIFNVVFSMLHDYIIWEIVLTLVYPFLSAGVRMAAEFLTCELYPDAMLETQFIFELWPAIYHQFQFATSPNTTINIFLLVTAFFEQMVEMIKFTRSWRQMRKIVRKKFLAGYLDNTNRMTVDLTFKTTMNNEKDIVKNVALASSQKGDLESSVDSGVPEPPIVPAISIKVDGECDTLAGSTDAVTKGRSLMDGNKIKQTASLDDTLAAPQLQKMRVEFESDKGGSVGEETLASTPSTQLETAAIKPPEKNPDLVSRDTLLSVAMSNKSGEEGGSKADVSEKAPKAEKAEGGESEYYEVHDRFKGQIKKVSFYLECYNWHYCNSLSLANFSTLIAPIVYWVLYTIMYWLPYNNNNYDIVQTGYITKKKILVSFQYVGAHFLLKLLTLIFLRYYLKNKYDIDNRAGMHYLLQERKWFLIIATSLIYITCLYGQFIATGFDIKFKFGWIEDKWIFNRKPSG